MTSIAATPAADRALRGSLPAHRDGSPVAIRCTSATHTCVFEPTPARTTLREAAMLPMRYSPAERAREKAER